MLTEKCMLVIDEAMTAIDNNSMLSAISLAHLESCIECRKSLEAVKALKASAKSVIPLACLAAMKGKISKSLEPAMQAKKASSVSSAVKATSIGGTAGTLVATILIGGAIVGGVVLTQTNSNKASINNELTINKTAIVENIATKSLDLNNEATIIEEKDSINKEKVSINKDEDSNFEANSIDMKDLSPKEYPVQTIPSPIVDR